MGRFVFSTLVLVSLASVWILPTEGFGFPGHGFPGFPGFPYKHTVDIRGLGKIKGQSNRTASDVTGYSRNFVSFTAIPYGTIQKRFLPATMRVPLTVNGNEFDATKPQISCWQVPTPLQPGPFTEDCLTLNVYTPEVNDKRRLPIIFFVHGGSFIRWGGNMFNPSRLLNEDVVVVTINYRLNVFGSVCTQNDDAPGNLALYDQVLALQWVRNYITHFGGDPSRVIIAGQSAGAASVLYLMDSPLATGLFRGAISSSGVDIAGWANVSPSQALANTLTAAAVVNCTSTDTSQMLTCMRATPAALLVQATNYIASPVPTVQSFNLSIPKVTPNSPSQSLQNGVQNPVPLIIGSNKNDGSFLVSRLYTQLAAAGALGSPAYLQNSLFPAILTSFGWTDNPVGTFAALKALYFGANANSGVWSDIFPGLTDVYSMAFFKSPLLATANGHSLLGDANPHTVVGDTYLYSFDYNSALSLYYLIGGVPQVDKGAAHVDDLMYVFNFGDFTLKADKEMSKRMIDIYTNFAYTLNPNGKSWFSDFYHHTLTWPKYNTATGLFYKIDAVPSVATNYQQYWVGATPPYVPVA